MARHTPNVYYMMAFIIMNLPERRSIDVSIRERKHRVKGI